MSQAYFCPVTILQCVHTGFRVQRPGVIKTPPTDREAPPFLSRHFLKSPHVLFTLSLFQPPSSFPPRPPISPRFWPRRWMERRGSLIYFLLYIRQGKESVKLLGWGRGGASCRFTIYRIQSGPMRFLRRHRPRRCSSWCKGQQVLCVATPARQGAMNY